MPSLPVHGLKTSGNAEMAGLRPDRSPSDCSLSIDALQLPLAIRDRALGVLGARAVVGKHVDDQEVGDRGRRLLAGRTNTGSGERALAGLSEIGVLRICSPHRRGVIGVQGVGQIAPRA